MNVPSLCFAIPYYSGLDYLRLTLESVAAQTSDDWNLWVVDDSGGDADAERLVHDFAGRFGAHRVRYARNPKSLGIGGNWNRCLELADAPLVNLLHADDLLEPNYLATMVEAHRRYPQAAAYFCRAAIIDGQGRRVFSFPDFYKRKFLEDRAAQTHRVYEGESALLALLAGNFIMCPTLCYQKSKIVDHLFSLRYRYALDLKMTTDLIAAGHCLVASATEAYRYRRHGSSASATGMLGVKFFTEELDLFAELAERARGLGWKNAEARARARRIIRLQISYYVLRDLLSRQWGAALAKLRLLK